METTEMVRRDDNAEELDIQRTQERVIESMVLRGDVSALGPKDRARFYVQTCRGLGLNPLAQPLVFLKLNGKEVLYAGKGATDQLAAKRNLTREIIDGPKVIDLAGTKLVYAVAKATLPNGRFETSTATVPLVDPVNVLMKCETKAKRRVTLSILGLAVLDEMELETIPAHVQEPGEGLDMSLVREEAAALPAKTEDQTGSGAEPSEMPPALEAFHARVGEIELPGEAVAVWIKHRADLGPLSASDREFAWRALCKKTEEVGKMKNAKVWLKKAIAEEDSRHPPDGTNGGAGRAPSGSAANSQGGAAEGSTSDATSARWEPVTTSSGVTIDDESAAREHLARMHPVALQHSFARHVGHRAWCELVVAALATRERINRDVARLRLTRSVSSERKAA